MPGTRGPDASAAFRLAANDCVMHADEALDEEGAPWPDVLPLTTPLVLVVDVVIVWPLLL